MGPQILETALTRKTRDSQVRRGSNTMHQSKGHSSSLVLTIRKCELWNSTLVYWLIIDSEPLGAHQSGLITLHCRQCSTQSHGLHTIPSPVASNNAACPRWKIANQDGESTTCAAMHVRTSGTPSSTVKYTVASGIFRQIEDKTKVAADERAPSRLPPSSPPPSEFLNLWHRATFIHHGSAMFIASAFVTRVYCLNKLPCAPQRSFFEASADCDELERDVAWLVTALQRVENTLVSVTRVECHANKYLVCSSSPIQLRLHALCPFHMNTIDDESPEGHCSICLHDTTPEPRSAYTTTRIIPVAKHATFQISSSGVGCWYRMRDPRCLRMTFGGFPGLEIQKTQEC
ncbi:unnamed protein product [Penicillium nalgiovense]|nr:unnamed protein product [Penicillium nalgiovense]